METFVINLDRDTERLAYMHAQLTQLGIPYKRISAFTASTEAARQHYTATEAKTITNYAMSSGEIGCALSHRFVYEHMVQENLPYALVLEDDVSLPENFKSIVETQVQKNHGSWEYLLFDYWEPGKAFRTMWFRSAHIGLERASSRGFLHALTYGAAVTVKGLYILPLSFFEAGRNSYKQSNPGPVTFFRPLYLAGAYLVTFSGAQKLLALSTPLHYPADTLPNVARRERNLRFMAYAPLCVRQLKEVYGSQITGQTGAEIYAMLNPSASHKSL